MARFRVILDTNVLFPIIQADLLLWLAHEGVYVPLWSAEILDELVRNLVSEGRTTHARAVRRADQMNRAFPDALVEIWESLVMGIESLPDPGDRHVVAATIEGHASAIVTNNLRDFPPRALDPHGLHARSCDDFLLDILDLAPQSVGESFNSMLELRKNPPIDLDDLLCSFDRATPRFAHACRARFG